MAFYNQVYTDDEEFIKYEKSIWHTLKGKKYIINSVLKEIDYPILKKICFMPSDIGIYFKLFYHRAPHNYFYLVDKFKQPLNYIRKYYHVLNVDFSNYDVCKPFKFHTTFDIILSLMALHLLSNIDCFFQNSYNNLAAEGRLVCVFLSSENAENHIMNVYFKKHVNNFYDPEQLNKILQKTGFKNTILKPIRFELRIDKDNIPNVFNKYSNSFLYQYKETSIRKFQEFLRELNVGNELILNQEYTMLIGGK